MTLPLRIWVRRSSAAFAFPALIVVEFVVLLSRSGWDHEWDWAFSNATSGAVLLCWLLAGLVAFDRARRVEPTLALLAESSPRGGSAVLALAVASWWWGMLAWALGIGYAGVRAWRGGASGTPDPWVFLEAPTLLLTSVGVGLAVGARMKGLLAGPAAVGLMFLARLFAGSALEGPFEAGGAIGSLVGMRRLPDQALALIGFHLSIAGFAVVVALFSSHAVRRRALLIRLVPVVCVVLAAAAALVSAFHGGNRYARTTSPDICVRGRVTVCGPESGRYVLNVAERSLSDAVTRLGGSGIPWQSTYILVSGNALPPDQGVLNALSEDITDGTMSRGDVVATLVAPRLCRDLFADELGPPVQAILADQDLVGRWVSGALTATGTGTTAPADVRVAYQRLRSCTPLTSPMP